MRAKNSMGAKLFSELKLVTDNLFSIYQWEQLIIASHIVKRSNIGDTKGLGRAAAPRVTAVKCIMACTRYSQDNIFTTNL